MTKLLLAAAIALMMAPLVHATTLHMFGGGEPSIVRIAEGCGNVARCVRELPSVQHTLWHKSWNHGRLSARMVYRSL